MGRLPHLRLYRMGTGVALIVAPVLFLLDNLLHPEEFERGNEAEQIAVIAEEASRWQLAHALGFLAIVAFAAAVLGLAFMVRRRRPLAGLVGGALAVVGLLGFAAGITIDGFAWGIAGEASTDSRVGPEAAAAFLEDLQESGWANLYYLTPVGFIAGLIVLTVAAIRAGALPAAAGGLLVVATIMVGTETTIISNAYFITGAAVFLVAGIACALAILGMSDEQFAQGST